MCLCCRAMIDSTNSKHYYQSVFSGFALEYYDEIFIPDIWKDFKSLHFCNDHGSFTLAL